MSNFLSMLPRAFTACFLLLASACAGLAQDNASPRVIERYKQMLGSNPVEGVALDRLWKIYQDKSATDQLLDEYRQLADKKDFPATMVLGHLLRRAGKLEDARAAFQQAATLDPKNPLPHLALAAMFDGQSDPKNAAGEYQAAAGLLDEKNPAFTDALLKLGSALSGAGDPARASEAWERIVAMDPNNLGLRQRLAENYVANNLPDKAILHYQFVAENGDAPQRAAALQSMARVYQMKGDTDDAIRSLEKAVQLTAPGNWLRDELQNQLIRQYQRARRTAELEQRWKKEAEENPRGVGAALQLASLYDRLGELEEEAAVLKKLTVLLPNNLDYKIHLARLYGQLNHPDDEAVLLDQILKVQPGDADAMFSRAEIDMQRDQPQAAGARIEAFLAQHKDDESLRGKAVDFYMRHRLFDAVEQHLKSATDENSVLALAGFYFSRHRDADAKRALQSLVKRDDPPEKQAAARFKIANVLKEQKEPEDAAMELKQAIQVQPGSPVYHLALGDLLAGLGCIDDARTELEKAYELGTDDSQKADADSKLFQLFQARAPRTGKPVLSATVEEEAFPGLVRRRAIMGTPAPDGLAGYVQKMIDAAANQPSVEAYLRVARWETWLRDGRQAIDFATKAVELKPDSIAAREALVKIASTVARPLAITQLDELAKLNPEKETAYKRQTARLQMEAGDLNEAVRIYSGLVRAKPGDVDVLTDLASALQQAGRWDESLAAWQQAFDLSPASHRKETGAPLARTMERLGRNKEAAAVLAGIADEQSDESQRATAFQDLLAFCTRYELLGWLQARYEEKLHRNADDYFVQIALAKILKATGRETDSFDLLSDATLSAPDQPAALRDLGAEAAARGDFKTAITCQKRVIVLAPQDDSGDMEKLAALEEAGLDLDGATTTWERIAAKFPRDPTALSHAGDYFQRWDDSARAREVLRKVVALDPADFQSRLTLGRLAAGAGDSKEALACFRNVLENSPVENEAGQIKFPGIKAGDFAKFQETYFAAIRLRNGQPNAGTMRALRSFWRGDSEKPSATGQPGPRLMAISAISELLKASGDKAAMQAWLAQWRDHPSASASEALWAFYYSGANDLVLKKLDDLMRQFPDDRRIGQGFLWLALQMGESAALNRWLADPARGADDRDFFMVCLGQMIGGLQGNFDPKLVEGLFPADYKSSQLMWQVAVQLASHGYFREAIKLGERVFQPAVTLRPVYGLELAHWHIYAGDVDGARRVLEQCIHGEGDSPDAMVYSALREYYFLLPEGERSAFVESYAHATEKSALHSAVSMSLLYGLQGDYDKARAELSKLLALEPMAYRVESDTPPAYRTWTFVLSAGVQFQLWKMTPLAVDLWQKSLADEAAVSLQGDHAREVVREIRLRLFAAKLVSANAAEADGLLDDYLHSTSPEMATTLATLLENSNCYAESIRVYRRLWRLQPGNQRFLMNLLNACRAANDAATEREVLKEAMGLVPQDPPDAAYLQVALQLSDRYLSDGDDHAARKLLEEALRLFPRNRELLTRAAALYGRQGQYDLAEKAYRQILTLLPGDSATRLALADLLESAGRTDAAIDVLSHSGAATPDENVRLARLYLKADKIDRAEHAAWELVLGRAYDKVPEIVTLFDGKGQGRQARKMLLVSLDRCKDAATLAKLQSKLLEDLPGDASPALIGKLVARQRRFATHSAQLQQDWATLAGVYDLREKLATALHASDRFQEELVTEWANGEGPAGAGWKLARLQASAGRIDKLGATCKALFARPDFDEQKLNGLKDALEKAGQWDLLAEAWRIVANKDPVRDEPVLNRIRALFAAGRKDEAADALEKLGARSVFNESTAGAIAREYHREGNAVAAAKWFEIAITRNSDAQTANLCFEYAELLLDGKNFTDAKRVLLLAFRNPAGHDAALLARYFIESGHEDRIGQGVREFGLDPGAVMGFYGQVVRYYQDRGESMKAIAFAEMHPEAVGPDREVMKRLHAAALAAGASQRVAALLEKVLVQSADDDKPDVSAELALVYSDWNDPAAALDHLKRANELDPANSDIVLSLARLYLEKSRPRDAVQMLTRYLDLPVGQAGKDRVKAMLAQIPSG